MERNELKKIRGDIGFTQEQMARFLEVSTSCYCKWEQGKTKISKLTGIGIRTKVEKFNTEIEA